MQQDQIYVQIDYIIDEVGRAAIIMSVVQQTEFYKWGRGLMEQKGHATSGHAWSEHAHALLEL